MLWQTGGRKHGEKHAAMTTLQRRQSTVQNDRGRAQDWIAGGK